MLRSVQEREKLSKSMDTLNQSTAAQSAGNILGTSFVEDEASGMKPATKFNFNAANAETSSAHSCTSSSVPASLLGSKVFRKAHQKPTTMGTSAHQMTTSNKENKLERTLSNKAGRKPNIMRKPF